MLPLSGVCQSVASEDNEDSVPELYGCDENSSVYRYFHCSGTRVSTQCRKSNICVYRDVNHVLLARTTQN